MTFLNNSTRQLRASIDHTVVTVGGYLYVYFIGGKSKEEKKLCSLVSRSNAKFYKFKAGNEVLGFERALVLVYLFVL